MHLDQSSGSFGGVVPTMCRVVKGVSGIEAEIPDWMDDSWVAANGPRIDSLKTGMILLHRGWFAVTEAVKSKRVYDLEKVYAAIIELASAAVKVASDVGDTIDKGRIKLNDRRLIEADWKYAAYDDVPQLTARDVSGPPDV